MDNGNKVYEYKTTTSIQVVKVIAWVFVFLGVAAISYGVSGFLRKNIHTTEAIQITYVALILFGYLNILTTVPLFLVANMCEDVHHIDYVLCQHNSVAVATLNHLREIENDLDAIKKGIATISGNMK